MSLYYNNMCISLFNQCNWDCKYCTAKNNNKPYNEDTILEGLETLKDKLDKLDLTGGEPGILSAFFWERLCKMNCKLSICTNGLFIHKNYHIKFSKCIRKIQLHCVPELDYDIHEKSLEFIRTENPFPVLPTLVIHNKNAHLLEGFLEKYSDITFHFSFTDSLFDRDPNWEYIYSIKKEACLEIFKVLAKTKKYSEYSERLIKSYVKNDFRYLNEWSKTLRKL